MADSTVGTVPNPMHALLHPAGFLRLSGAGPNPGVSYDQHNSTTVVSMHSWHTSTLPKTQSCCSLAVMIEPDQQPISLQDTVLPTC